MTLSVLTLVRNREAHLRELVEGLRRSSLPPAELIVVDMSDVPVAPPAADFRVRVDRFETQGLPLAAARNRAAALSQGDRLLFLDVDCIPMRDCLARMDGEMRAQDGLFCADVRYLPPMATKGGWSEATLLQRGRSHPVRPFPQEGVRREPNPGLFWSLAFGLRRDLFATLGGFDEGYVGYGAEDTDFGFRAAEAGVPLLFVGGALACHQYHDSFDPPVQHLEDIVGNAARFRARWGVWPMEGWLAKFAAMGLIQWRDENVRILRRATSAEREAARVTEPA